MQRMFVSTVYLSTAKRYIRHAAHRHARTQTHTHTQGYRDLCANKHTVNDVNAHKHSLCLSLEHMYKHEHTQAQRIWVEIKIVVGVFIAGQLSKCQTDREQQVKRWQFKIVLSNLTLLMNVKQKYQKFPSVTFPNCEICFSLPYGMLNW